jgi:glucose dehydrogenase
MSRKSFTEADLTDASAEDHAAAKAMFDKFYGNAGPYVPVGLDQNTLVIPGFGGGNEWGGMATDHKGVIYAAVSNSAGMTRMALNNHFLVPPEPGGPPPPGGAQNGYALLKYAFTGYGQFRLPNGHPGLKGPNMVLNAVDLNTGEYRWVIPFESGRGGPVATESGVLFIPAAGTLDAYDTKDGKLLWQGKLPNATGLTPAVYMVDGKEYVALASGGRGATAYVAFALPN